MKKVIVVGAGMAGLMATRTLQEAGVEVLCLEARPRIGGRTHTDESLGVSADLGAAWIHGPIGNPFTPIAHELGIAYGETDFINRSGHVVQAYGKEGEPLDMVEYTAGHYAGAAAFSLQSGSLLVDPPESPPQSLADGLANLPRPEGMSQAKQFGFDFWVDLHLTYLNAADRDTIDWNLMDTTIRLPGDDYFIYGGGYKAITTHLAAGLDIRTGVEVTDIAYDETGVTVESSAGTFAADFIIVTVPLGVLKAGAIRFSPELSAEKQGAIERIGFGQYEKVVLRFDDFYWPRDKQRLISFHDPAANEPQLFPLWFNIGYYTGEPVILAYHAGALARFINRWDDETLVGRATDALRQMVRNDAIPDPVGYVRTGWERDPFSRGSYSFERVGQKVTDRDTLRQPIGRLYFAGEATHPHFNASAHGAYESGVWAARQILKNC